MIEFFTFLMKLQFSSVTYDIVTLKTSSPDMNQFHRHFCASRFTHVAFLANGKEIKVKRLSINSSSVQLQSWVCFVSQTEWLQLYNKHWISDHLHFSQKVSILPNIAFSSFLILAVKLECFQYMKKIISTIKWHGLIAKNRKKYSITHQIKFDKIDLRWEWRKRERKSVRTISVGREDRLIFTLIKSSCLVEDNKDGFDFLTRMQDSREQWWFSTLLKNIDLAHCTLDIFAHNIAMKKIKRDW